MWKSFLMLSAVVVLTSCGKEEGNEKLVKPKNFYVNFEHGNPESLLGKSSLNKESFLTVDNIKKFDGFMISSIITFSNKSKKDTRKPQTKEEAQEQIEGGQKPAEEKLPEASVISVKEKDHEYFMEINLKDTKMSLVFSNINNVLVLKYLEGNGERVSVETLHNSVKENHSAFSFLFKFIKEDMDYIFSITALEYTGKEKISPKMEEKYNTLLARGYETKWHEETITLHTCGMNEKDNLNIEKMISIWSDKNNMSIGENTKIKVEPLKTYYPFSDVNQHCIYFINDFLIENTDQSTVPAFTLAQIHYRTGKIYDADILMMKKSFEKIESFQEAPQNLFDTTILESDLNTKSKSYFTHVVQHEFGHFLGLDHIFDGTESIMSYNHDKDGKPDILTSYDHKAINMLYKKRE